MYPLSTAHYAMHLWCASSQFYCLQISVRRLPRTSSPMFVNHQQVAIETETLPPLLTQSSQTAGVDQVCIIHSLSLTI